MQALWSRTVQTKSCRCRACLNVATTLARRSTSAASRRQLNINDVFTACYSTILGTAAFVDAKAKQERRKEWDRVIEDAKSRVIGPDTQEDIAVHDGESLDHTKDISFNPNASKLSTPVKALLGADNVWALGCGSPEGPLQTRLRELDNDIKGSISSNTTRLALSGLQHKAGCIAAAKTEYCEALHIRDVQKIREGISRLVGRLLRSTPAFSSHFQGCDSFEMTKAKDKLFGLLNQHQPLPHFSATKFAEIVAERKQLNDSLRVMFEKATDKASDLDLLLAKVCYNLLICTAPPQIDTFNLLIASLTRQDAPHKAEIVVKFILYNTSLVPTQKTIQYMLDVYRAKKDAKEFRHIIQRMAAREGSMKLSRPLNSAIGMPMLSSWAKGKKYRLKNGYFHEIVQKNASIYDSLILGSIELLDVRDAVRYTRAALREGISITGTVLAKLVKKLQVKRDVLAAWSLLQAIVATWKLRRIHDLKFPFDAMSGAVIEELISLCGVSQPLKAGAELLRIEFCDLESLVRNIELQSLAETIDIVTMHVSELLKALGVPVTHQQAAETRVSTSLARGQRSGLKQALLASQAMSQALQQKAEGSLLRHQQNKMLVMKVLDWRLDRQWKKIYEIQQQLLLHIDSCLVHDYKLLYRSRITESRMKSYSSRLRVITAIYREQLLGKEEDSCSRASEAKLAVGSSYDSLPAIEVEGLLTQPSGTVEAASESSNSPSPTEMNSKATSEPWLPISKEKARVAHVHLPQQSIPPMLPRPRSEELSSPVEEWQLPNATGPLEEPIKATTTRTLRAAVG
ncbi:hypothetical protein BP5796_08172 [Coleophoma crateriformis]|uniref:Pentatricopeptide repeat domain-containing protein n=1 Tax=Coleophoma crateriformis TaxID=565419 RepID=A0A3D8RDZ1_9HELO|nr:hypothetical protein BP5796_08172 [Coleophoma crateriformis]